MTRKEKLGHIIFALDGALDMVDDVNTTDEIEELYCRLRDIISEFMYMEEEEK